MYEEKNSYNDSFYEDTEKSRNPLITIIRWILVLFLLFVIIILLLKGCGSKVGYDDLLNAGKKYFAQNQSEMPTNKGECNTVTLGTLKSKNLLKKNYDSCDVNETLVKVCILNNGNRQYTPILSCKNIKTQFTDFKDGEESNLIKDSSDVKFTYQATIGGNKVYYPKDEEDASKVNEYYVESPAEGYTYKDNSTATTVYQYYRNTTNKIYYNNGELLQHAPSGYPYSDSKTSKTLYSITKPSGASTEVTLYRTYTIAHLHQYACTTKNEGVVVYSNVPCTERTDDAKTFLPNEFTYTCQNGDNVTDASKNNLKKKCSDDYSQWSEKACETKPLTGTGCESKQGYKYTVDYYKWYKTETVRHYYPSDNGSEKTYYATTPKDGYIKDETSATTGYKYYKLVDDKGQIITSDSGLSITDGYVSLDELIKACRDKGYEVKSLEDINEIEDISYEIKMQYRNRI